MWREYLLDLYIYIFSRKLFYKLHIAMYYLSLHGLGVLNFRSFRSSGEEWFLQKTAPLIKTAIDVGANEGEYSIRIAKLNPDASIYACEPHPLTFSRLSDKTKGTNIRTYNIGLSSREEESKIFDYRSSSGSSHASLHKDVFGRFSKEEVDSCKVSLMMLDSFVEREDIKHIDLLKIDTEGHEYDVLQGATDNIRSHNISFIHFEFNEMNVISNHFFNDFCSILPGYNFYRLLPSGMIPLPDRPVLREIFAYQNIIAVHPEYASSIESMGMT